MQNRWKYRGLNRWSKLLRSAGEDRSHTQVFELKFQYTFQYFIPGWQVRELILELYRCGLNPNSATLGLSELEQVNLPPWGLISSFIEWG